MDHIAAIDNEPVRARRHPRPRVPWYAALVLPLLFTAGMTLFDSADGILARTVYRWGADPPRHSPVDAPAPNTPRTLQRTVLHPPRAPRVPLEEQVHTMGAFLAIPLGLLIGAILGLVGAGGSIVPVPALVYGVGLSPEEAVPSSLIIVGLAALTAVLPRIRKAVSRSRCNTHLLTGGTAFGAELLHIRSGRPWGC